MKVYGLLIILFVGFSTAVDAKISRESTALKGMSIKGDAEEPQVLYILPWQEAKEDKLFSTISSESRKKQFLDRDSFVRMVDLHQNLFPTSKNLEKVK